MYSLGLLGHVIFESELEKEAMSISERWAWEHGGKPIILCLYIEGPRLSYVFLMPPMPIVLSYSFLFLLACTIIFKKGTWGK